MHAFGPLVAAGLLWWSIRAIRQRRLLVLNPSPRALAWRAAAIAGYWLLRLALNFGFGLEGFPAN
jgi:hypothetical protein